MRNNQYKTSHYIPMSRSCPIVPYSCWNRNFWRVFLLIGAEWESEGAIKGVLSRSVLFHFARPNVYGRSTPTKSGYDDNSNKQHRIIKELLYNFYISCFLSMPPMEDWFILAAATSIVSTILPITSAEPALFGVYAGDLFSRWRALRGFLYWPFIF